MRSLVLFVITMMWACSEGRGQDQHPAPKTIHAGQAHEGAAKRNSNKQPTHSSSVRSRQTGHAPATKLQKKGGAPPILKAPRSLTERQWRARLSPLQYKILREKGTEPRGGPLLSEKRTGTYHCAACGMPLYRSTTKFDSGTGWPSFYRAIKDRVQWIPDHSFGMKRTEIVCAHCEGHLGHVFMDGPQPTGLRHCVNSASLEFVETSQVD